MKRLFLCVAVLSILISCKKTSYVAKFDKLPQERAAEQISLVSSTLTGATNGWIATLPTQAGGGYGFYMSFDNSNNVVMYGDMTATSSSTSGASYYRIKQDLGTELVFDTYNYISMLDDPNGTLGGASKIGYSSDIEFTFDRIAGDSIIFIGKKYRQPFKLVKATAAQKASYLAGEYKTAIDKFSTSMSGIKNPYIELGTGAQLAKIGVSINTTNNLTLGKRIDLSGLASDGKVLSGTGKYAFNLNGAELLGNGILINGVRLVRILFKDATTLAFYDDKGTEYIIKSNPSPLTPLASLFGFPTTFPYRRISIPSTGLAAGVTSEFTAVYNQMLALFIGTGRSVTSTNFILTSNSVFTVEVNYLSGTSAFVASATYNYTKVGDVITLDNNPVPNVNWPTRAVQIKPLADYMLTGPFKIDWVSSSNPAVPNLGGLYRTGNLGSFIYGAL
ncbi:DUF4302 domain-containing protein [Pedobacter sp. Du54]|uniref:DUF4302 domain-containing protein n=1 Tax=Pedobacter anseongensis TaxID=3133439 RepID=UPI00309E5E0A